MSESNLLDYLREHPCQHTEGPIGPLWNPDVKAVEYWSTNEPCYTQSIGTLLDVFRSMETKGIIGVRIRADLKNDGQVDCYSDGESVEWFSCGHFLEYVKSNDCYYADWIDDVLTIYHNAETHEVIGAALSIDIDKLKS